jgi:hypothetical protein
LTTRSTPELFKAACQFLRVLLEGSDCAIVTRLRRRDRAGNLPHLACYDLWIMTWSWDAVATHSAAFLLGAAMAAAGQYLADRFTDQRRRQETRADIQARWAKIVGAMPAFIVEMKQNLSSAPLVREFIVLPSKHVAFGGGKLQPRFRYYEDEHPQLRGQLAMLEDYGYIRDVTPRNTPIYRMTEEFVELVLRSEPGR